MIENVPYVIKIISKKSELRKIKKVKESKKKVFTDLIVTYRISVPAPFIFLPTLKQQSLIQTFENICQTDSQEPRWENVEFF